MNKRNLVLDCLLFVAFMVAMVPSLSGETLHEWIGFGLLLAVVFHLVLHWDWIVGVASRYFKKVWHISRLKFIVDFAVFLFFVTVCLSGLMISRSILPSLGIQISQTNMIWKSLHNLSADILFFLIGLHFALNWNCVVETFKRYLFSPFARLFKRNEHSRPLVPVEVKIDGIEKR